MPKTRLPTIEELSDTCTACGHQILPREIVRLDINGNCRCVHCGKTYNNGSRVEWHSAPIS